MGVVAPRGVGKHDYVSRRGDEVHMPVGLLRISHHESDSTARVLLGDFPPDIDSRPRSRSRLVLEDWVSPETGVRYARGLKGVIHVGGVVSVDDNAFHGCIALCIKKWGVYLVV